MIVSQTCQQIRIRTLEPSPPRVPRQSADWSARLTRTLIGWPRHSWVLVPALSLYRGGYSQVSKYQEKQSATVFLI